MNDINALNNVNTLNNNATFNVPAMAAVTLEPGNCAATVDVIDLAPDRAGFKLDEYLKNSTPTPGGLVTVLESWANARESWEGIELAASHARLYAILGQCYGYYLTMKSENTTKGVRLQLVAALDAFIQQRGLKTLASTHDMNKVVKAVFGEDRRRVSAYAMALRVALESGSDVMSKSKHVPESDLAKWIESKGGIEEIRLGSKNAGLSTSERVNVAAAAIEKSAPLLTFHPDAKTMPFGSNDVDKKLVLLVMYRPTGDLEVLSVVKNDSVVRAALAAHYSEHKDDMPDSKAGAQPAAKSAVSQALAIY